MTFDNQTEIVLDREQHDAGEEINQTTEVFKNITFEYNSQLILTQVLLVVGTNLRQNPYYYKVYVIYMNLVINGLIPLVALVTLNSLVYRKLREFSMNTDSPIRTNSVRTREVKLAKVSCLIVAGRN